jgi:hypothetical protein
MAIITICRAGKNEGKLSKVRITSSRILQDLQSAEQVRITVSGERQEFESAEQGRHYIKLRKTNTVSRARYCKNYSKKRMARIVVGEAGKGTVSRAR